MKNSRIQNPSFIRIVISLSLLLAISIDSEAQYPECSQIPQWQPDAVYAQAGIKVIHLEKVYENKWWTTGEDPSQSGEWGVWSYLEDCIPDEDPVLTSIVVSPSLSSIPLNGAQQFNAQGKDQNGNNIDASISWSATGGSINSSGLFSGSSVGTFTVNASSGTVTGSATVTVTDETPVLTSIEVSPSSAFILLNETQQFIAQGKDQNGNNMNVNVSWSATGGSINLTGQYSGSAKGTFTVTAHSGAVAGTASVIVSDSTGEAGVSVAFNEVNSWGTGYTGEIVIKNNSSATIEGWSLSMTLPEKTTIANSWGQAEWTASSNNEHTFTNNASSSTIAPGAEVKIGVEGAIEAALRVPATAIFNGAQVDVTTNVVIPDALERPRTYYLDQATYKETGEIKIGEGRLNPIWHGSLDARIPANRVSWAIAITHAHQIFRNVIGIDNVPLNSWWATALKESRGGCDPDIEVQNGDLYPIEYMPTSDLDGCFQIERPPSAYAELINMYPHRYPEADHGLLIGGDHFETAAIGKAYYDMFGIRWLEVTQGWNPIEFFVNAKDPLATVKAMAGAYNRGLWSPLVSDIFKDKRTEALNATDLLSIFPAQGFAKDHAQAISDYTAVFDNNLHLLKPEQREIDPGTGMPFNIHYGYYDTLVSWSDVDRYLDRLIPLYNEVDMAAVKIIVHSEFDQIANGSSVISFRTQMGAVIDAITMALPVDDPTQATIERYGYMMNPLKSTKPYETELQSLTFELKHVSPNPFDITTEIHLELHEDALTKIDIYNIQGQLVDVLVNGKITAGEHIITFDASYLPGGIYICKVISGNGTKVQPIIKR